MRLRVSILLFGVFLLVAAASWAAAGADGGKAPIADEALGSSAQRPLWVSIIQLIATPDAFDGKYVMVVGFVLIEHEGTAVYLHREDGEQGLMKNGLWLTVNDVAAAGSKEAKVKNNYALIVGKFASKKKGHLGLWSDTIEDIARMESQEVQKGGK